MAARRRVSNLLSFVSAGTQGRVVFNLQNALLSTLIRARSLALAAFLGARLSKSSLLYLPSDANSSSSASSVGVEARRFRGIFCNHSNAIILLEPNRQFYFNHLLIGELVTKQNKLDHIERNNKKIMFWKFFYSSIFF